MKTKDWLAFIGLSLAWGSSFLWIKIAVQEIGPFTLVALRLLFGVLGLMVVVAIQRPVFPKERRLWLALIVLGITNTAGTIPGIVGVLVSGWILEVTGSWALVFQVAAGVTAFGLIFYLIFGSGERQFEKAADARTDRVPA